MSTEKFVPSTVKRILLDEDEIDKRVRQLASEINVHYQGKELVIVGILKGAFVFMGDLTKRLTVDNVVDFMSLSSYGDTTSSSGNVRIIMDMRRNIVGKHVLLIEGRTVVSKVSLILKDIVDTGYTLNFLFELLKLRNPASLECCVLVRKPKCLKMSIPVKWIGTLFFMLN
jgi:hypoxanthine phosphoribosyltransferase